MIYLNLIAVVLAAFLYLPTFDASASEGLTVHFNETPLVSAPRTHGSILHPLSYMLPLINDYRR